MKPRREQAGWTWLLFLAAPIVWFAHFSALYGIAAFASPPGRGLLWTLTGLAALAAAGAWYLARRLAGRSNAKPAVAEMAQWLALLSLAGILFQVLPLSM